MKTIRIIREDKEQGVVIKTDVGKWLRRFFFPRLTEAEDRIGKLEEQNRAIKDTKDIYVISDKNIRGKMMSFTSPGSIYLEINDSTIEGSSVSFVSPRKYKPDTMFTLFGVNTQFINNAFYSSPPSSGKKGRKAEKVT